MIDNELQKLKGKIDLSRQEMLDVMDLIMSGSLQDNEIEEFLIAMNERVHPLMKYLLQLQ